MCKDIFKLPKNMVFLGGSSFVGKTTICKKLTKKDDVVFRKYPKNDPIHRIYNHFGYLLETIELANNDPDTLFIFDRAPIDYYVWSNKIYGYKFPLIEWEFVKKTLKNTILVYKPIDIEAVAKERNLDKEKLKKSQDYYRFFAFDQRFASHFANIIHLDKNSFLELKHFWR